MLGYGEVAERLRRSTVRIDSKHGRGSGSGVVWTAGGQIVTNAHVARTAGLQVELWDGRIFPGQLAARDARRDLALLRIEADHLEPASAASSSGLRPGQLVIAVGSPGGFAGTLSTGVVHSVGPVHGMGPQPWIRADVRLAPGNSGGPLANAPGEVIGINTAIVNGLGLAVPADLVSEFLLVGPRPALGLTLRPVPLGLLILEVDPQGAAATASLRAGDILLLPLSELSRALDSGQDVLHLRFVRGGGSAGRLPVREASVRLAAARPWGPAEAA